MVSPYSGNDRILNQRVSYETLTPSVRPEFIMHNPKKLESWDGGCAQIPELTFLLVGRSMLRDRFVSREAFLSLPSPSSTVGTQYIVFRLRRVSPCFQKTGFGFLAT